MTAPTTAETPTTRENLERTLCNALNMDWAIDRPDCQAGLDAILRKMLEPSVELRMFMEDALWGDAAADDVHKSWCEIIQHILDEPKD